MKRAFQDTYSLVVAAVVVVLFVVLIGLLPHFALLFSLSELHLGVLVSLFFSTFSSLENIQVLFMVVTAVLLFVNTTLLVFYIRKKKKMSVPGFAPAGLSGVIASIFGIGCGSCGTVIGTSLLGIFGASGLLASLPFGGQELSVVGFIIFLISIRYLAKKINDPDICQI